MSKILTFDRDFDDDYNVWEINDGFLTCVYTARISAILKQENQDDPFNNIDGKSVVGYRLQAGKLSDTGVIPAVRGGLTLEDVYVSKQQTYKVGVESVVPGLKNNEMAMIPATLQFDMRALAYQCGIALARYSVYKRTGLEGDIGLPFVAVTDGGLVITSECFVLDRSSNPGDAEMTSMLLRQTGMDGRIKFVGTTLPCPNGPRSERKCVNNVWNVAQRVLNQATLEGEANSHLLAFWMGIASVITVRSHTDEGGWVRNALTNVQFPRPRGRLHVHSTYNVRFNPRPTYSNVINTVVSTLLEGSAAIMDGDPIARNGVLTLWTRPADGEPVSIGRPSEWYELRNVVLNMYVSIGKTLATGSGVEAYETAYDMGRVCEPYFSADKVDNHLAHDMIMPYAFIEPSGACALLTGTNILGPGGQYCERKLKFMPYAVAPGVPEGRSIQTSASGRNSGDAIDFVLRGGGWRTSGATYVASNRWNKNNGLSTIARQTSNDFGLLVGIPHMTRPPPDVGGVAQKPTADNELWLHTDNPVPLPGSGYAPNKPGIAYQLQSLNYGRRHNMLTTKYWDREVVISVSCLTHSPVRGYKPWERVAGAMRRNAAVMLECAGRLVGSDEDTNIRRAAALLERLSIVSTNVIMTHPGQGSSGTANGQQDMGNYDQVIAGQRTNRHQATIGGTLEPATAGHDQPSTATANATTIAPATLVVDAQPSGNPFDNNQNNNTDGGGNNSATINTNNTNGEGND